MSYRTLDAIYLLLQSSAKVRFYTNTLSYQNRDSNYKEKKTKQPRDPLILIMGMFILERQKSWYWNDIMLITVPGKIIVALEHGQDTS